MSEWQYTCDSYASLFLMSFATTTQGISRHPGDDVALKMCNNCPCHYEGVEGKALLHQHQEEHMCT